MNDAHEAKNFTIEKGNSDEAFLDVQVRQKESRFITLVYTK